MTTSNTIKIAGIPNETNETVNRYESDNTYHYNGTFNYNDKVIITYKIEVDLSKVDKKQLIKVLKDNRLCALSFYNDLLSVYIDKGISNYSNNLDFNYPIRIYPSIEKIGNLNLNNKYL